MSEFKWDDTPNSAPSHRWPAGGDTRWLRATAGWLVVALAACVSLPKAGLADDVNVTTSTSDGISLDGFSGTTVNVASGVSVADTNFTNNCSSFASLCATTQAWSLTNQGTIGPSNFGDAVNFKKGGSVVNMGSIDGGSGGNGVWIEGAPGSVDNKAGATIHGTNGGIVFPIAGPVGTVTNAGTIESGGTAVGLGGGGSFTNLAGGIVISHGESNAVSVILGTSRTVTNSGLIQSNDSGYATGVALQNGTLLNNAGGQILGAYNGVWANGSSATSITNAGLIEASKAAGGGSAIEVDGGGTVVNSGTIRSSSTDTSDAGILFSGAGSITNSGNIGSLTGGLAIKFQGAGTHALSLDTGSVLGGNVQGGSGTDTLVLLGTGTESAAKFLGFETLSMQGTDWTMTGTGAFATGVTVQSGVLHVNGQITSPQVQVLSGGTLAGTGTVVGATSVASGGTIAPGNSIGTLNVTGALTFGSGSFYAVEANDAGQADKIVATGVATIQGGTVKVLAGAGSYAPATTYTILTANGGRTGTFSGVTSNFAFLTPSLTYDDNNVYLTLDRNSIDFGAIGGTRNERAAGHGIESLGSGNAIYDAVLPLDIHGARTAFDLLSGEVHASARTVLIDDSRFVREAVLDRLRALQDVGAVSTPALADADGGPPTRTAGEGMAVWQRDFGAWGHWEGDGNAAAVGRDIGGILVGTDGSVGEDWRLGLFGGYSRSTISVGERASSATSNDYHLGLYAGTHWGDLAFRSGLAYAWHDISVERDVTFSGFSDDPKSDYHAGTAQAFGEFGYRLAALQLASRSLVLETFANLAYVDLSTNGFTEEGGAAALAVRGGHDGVTLTTLGMRAAAGFNLGGGMSLTARGMLGWRHACGDTTPIATMAFSGGTPFDIAGVPMTRDAATVEGGLDVALSPAATLGLSYSGQFGSGSADQSLRGTLMLRF